MNAAPLKIISVNLAPDLDHSVVPVQGLPSNASIGAGMTMVVFNVLRENAWQHKQGIS
jgi:hypothetical protein